MCNEPNPALGFRVLNHVADILIAELPLAPSAEKHGLSSSSSKSDLIVSGDSLNTESRLQARGDCGFG